MDANEAMRLLIGTGVQWRMQFSEGHDFIPNYHHPDEWIISLYLNNTGKGETLEEAVKNVLAAYAEEIRRPSIIHGEIQLQWLKSYEEREKLAASE